MKIGALINHLAVDADLAGLERGSIYLATSTLNRLSEALGAFISLYPEVNFRITQASGIHTKCRL